MNTNIDAQNKVERDLEGAYAELQALVVRMTDHGFDKEAIDFAYDAIIALDRLWDYLNDGTLAGPWS